MLIWVFLYAEFISALKTEPKSMVFEKHAKVEKNIYHHYFLLFVIFSKSLKQKCLIPTESCFLDGKKKPNIARLVDIIFLLFEKHAKIGKKNIYHHYFLVFVIFSKSLKQKCLIPNESCFLDGKKPNIAKFVDINFLADNEKNRQAIGFAKMEG